MTFDRLGERKEGTGRDLDRRFSVRLVTMQRKLKWCVQTRHYLSFLISPSVPALHTHKRETGRGRVALSHSVIRLQISVGTIHSQEAPNFAAVVVREVEEKRPLVNGSIHHREAVCTMQ